MNDDKFLKVMEAMYGNNDDHLAQKLLDYDYCNYQGVILLSYSDIMFLDH